MWHWSCSAFIVLFRSFWPLKQAFSFSTHYVTCTPHFLLCAAASPVSMRSGGLFGDSLMPAAVPPAHVRALSATHLLRVPPLEPGLCSPSVHVSLTCHFRLLKLSFTWNYQLSPFPCHSVISLTFLSSSFFFSSLENPVLVRILFWSFQSWVNFLTNC